MREAAKNRHRGLLQKGQLDEIDGVGQASSWMGGFLGWFYAIPATLDLQEAQAFWSIEDEGKE